MNLPRTEEVGAGKPSRTRRRTCAQEPERPSVPGRVVLVSNRVIDLTNAAQAGGVAVAIADVLRKREGLWFGWNGEVVEDGRTSRNRVQRTEEGGTEIATVPLSASENERYYLGYANSVLWPVFHNRLDLARFEATYFASYVAVNRRFARVLRPLLRPDDVIWVHDYHLIPLARELRALGVGNAIGYFLHIPFPPLQTFLAIPEHRNLLRALAAYDLVGLQTKADVASFIDTCKRCAHGRVLPRGRMRAFDRTLSIADFPVGIDVSDFAHAKHVETAVQGRPSARRIIGIDRLDYTKGLPNKFQAYGRFLEKYPEYCRDVILTQIAPPTRQSVDVYTDIRLELEALSASINGRYGELDWVPIHYIHRPAPREALGDIYRSSRIALVTPLRDGMNLVAKEYVAAQDPDDPGVLILSRFAGAAEQLTAAILVNPYNIEEMADAIQVALEMSLQERRERHATLISTIRQSDTCAWTEAFLTALSDVPGAEKGAGAWRLARTPRLAFRKLQDMLTPNPPRPREETGVVADAPKGVLRGSSDAL